MAYFQAIGGLLLLVFAADFLVRGSVSLAQRLGVHTLVIGLTIVSFGTSAPELLVGIDAVLTGAPTLALGNVVGSNIANILLVVGLPAIMAPMMCSSSRFKHNMVALLISTAAFIAIACSGTFTPLSGALLLVMLIGFLFYVSRKLEDTVDFDELLSDIEGVPDEPDDFGVSIALVVGGLAGLAVGAHLLVTGSIEIARDFGVSEALIGLTLVAVGTSLPELVTSIVAAVRNHCDVAVGNVIGSNIFNLLGIIGVSSMIRKIPVPDAFLRFDLWVMAGATLLLLPYALMHRRIGRRSGVVFCLLYAAYLYILASGIGGIGALHRIPETLG